MTTTTNATALAPDAIYLGDNGRALCNALQCAGYTAMSSGRDLSGQEVMRMDVAAVR